MENGTDAAGIVVAFAPTADIMTLVLSKSDMSQPRI